MGVSFDSLEFKGHDTGAPTSYAYNCPSGKKIACINWYLNNEDLLFHSRGYLRNITNDGNHAEIILNHTSGYTIRCDVILVTKNEM